MEEALKYRQQFLEVAGEIELNLSLILEDWGSFLSKRDELDDLYRMIHSLKSGAAFLEMSELEQKAHRAEDGIEAIRKGGSDGSELYRLLNEILDHLAENLEEEEPVSEVFTPRENLIMDKARKRGEQVYRIVCMIDPAEPMKKARAFLIQNNLEIGFNVIKTVPSLDREDDFSRFTLYITTSEKKDALRRAVDVDRVREIRIEQYVQGDEEPDAPEVLTVQNEARRHPVSVEMDRLDEIRHYLEEIGRSGGRDRNKLIALTSGINRVLKGLMYEPLRTLGEGAHLYLNKMSERYGKRVSFTLQGGDMMLSLGWLQPLTEIFQQLIRNSLTHGISREGHVTISSSLVEGQQVIRYYDNGRGLDLEKIHLLGGGEDSLLDILCRPGFTTASQADTLSGRGIGMNLVKHNTEMIGGKLSLEHDGQGKNLVFVITLPAPDVIPILQYRVDDQIATLPRHFVEKELEVDRRQFKRNRQNRFFYHHEGVHIPLFEMDKPVKTLDIMRRSRFIIIISYLTKRYALLADELLLESRIGREELETLNYIDPATLGAQ
ncbi:MAG: ATP-binding protein [Spirochaetales bacterium]|nr:ATP-binding protein [Spirochaetales bacterium]